MEPIEFVVAGFDGHQTADRAMQALRTKDSADELNVLNLAVVKKDPHGKVSITDDGDVKPGGGAIFGALVGAIIGFLGGPGGMVVGAAAGAITGGVTAASIDLGFSQESLDAIKDSLPHNRSVVLALVEADSKDRLIEEIHSLGGRIITTARREEIITRLRKEQNKDWEKF